MTEGETALLADLGVAAPIEGTTEKAERWFGRVRHCM
jgi:hypothetical protein